MPPSRLVGFQQLDRGCLVARHHEATIDRDLSYVENKRPGCRCTDHRFNHLIPADALTSPITTLAATSPRLTARDVLNVGNKPAQPWTGDRRSPRGPSSSSVAKHDPLDQLDRHRPVGGRLHHDPEPLARPPTPGDLRATAPGVLPAGSRPPTHPPRDGPVHETREHGGGLRRARCRFHRDRDGPGLPRRSCWACERRTEKEKVRPNNATPYDRIVAPRLCPGRANRPTFATAPPYCWLVCSGGGAKV